VTAGGAPAVLARIRRAAETWPPILRDIGAAAVALLCVCVGEVAASALPLPAEVLLALPGVLLAWFALGWPSAVFALLDTAEEPVKLALLAAALIAAVLAARVWVRARERRAGLLMDACAQEALRRIAAAEAETQAAHAALSRAEAALAEARARHARAIQDAAFQEARLREGGI
jgi:hypothetical protein